MIRSERKDSSIRTILAGFVVRWFRISNDMCVQGEEPKRDDRFLALTLSISGASREESTITQTKISSGLGKDAVDDVQEGERRVALLSVFICMGIHRIASGAQSAYGRV